MVRQFLDHTRQVLCDDASGYKPNRTGVDSISLFGYQDKYDLRKGFPLVTSKDMPFEMIVHELLWFLRGDTNIKYLVDHKVPIWNKNAFDEYLKRHHKNSAPLPYSEAWHEQFATYIEKIRQDEDFAMQEGTLGPVYGSQWKAWEAKDGRKIDQIEEAISLLQHKPSSRRIIVSAWNVPQIEEMALPPCHLLFQCNVQDDRMDLQLYQRSADMFLGVPFNIASYALLATILARQANLEPGYFSHCFGDSHLYCGQGARGAAYGEHLSELKSKVGDAKSAQDYLDIRNWIEHTFPPENPDHKKLDHVPLVLEQLSRDTKPLPNVHIADKPIEQLTIEDFVLENYSAHPGIRAKMAV